MRGIIGSYLAVVAGLLAAPQALAAEPNKDYGASGRVAAVEGTLLGKGPYDTETSELAVNAVLRQGDEVFTDEGTFAEIELPGRTFLRLAGKTSLTFQKMDNSTIDIAIVDGAAYLSRADNGAPSRFVSASGTVELGGRSMVRVTTDSEKKTLEISVADGSAELRGEHDTQQVRAKETLVMSSGRPVVNGFDPKRGDAFDQWNDGRETKARGYGANNEHIASDAVGGYELEGNGTWVNVDGYWAWRPTVAADWRPYSNGYWSWIEPMGWTWVDYAPWGYCTSHYGRWYYRHSYGWVWYADPYWAPAWVVWAAFDGSLGWAPCDFWGRPIYCYSYYSYYDYGAWCYCDANYFYNGGGYHYYGATTIVHGVVSYGANVNHAVINKIGRGQLGRSGQFAIKKFDPDTMKRGNPVPVRDPGRELAPRHIVDAAKAGRIRGVGAADRGGDIVSRAAVGGGVKAEPWNRGNTGARNLNERGTGANERGTGATGAAGAFGNPRNEHNEAATGTTGNDRIRTQPWGTNGRTETTGTTGRTNEGWTPRGNTPASHFQPVDRGAGTSTTSEPARGGWGGEPARGGSSEPARGGSWEPARGGSSEPARGGSEPARGGSTPSRGGSSSPSTAPSGGSRPSGGSSSGGGSHPSGSSSGGSHSSSGGSHSSGSSTSGTKSSGGHKSGGFGFSSVSSSHSSGVKTGGGHSSGFKFKLK